MRCKNCDFELGESSKFCPECGSSADIDSGGPSNSQHLPDDLIRPRKSRTKLVIAMSLLVLVGISSVFVGNLSTPSLEERVNQLNQADPVADDELDLELFEACFVETNLYTGNVMQEMNISLTDLGGGYEAIAVAATRGSLADANKALSEFPDYAPGFARMSGQFHSASHCGSATLDSYNAQIASVAGEIASDLRKIPSEVLEVGPEYDRILENLDEMSLVIKNFVTWLLVLDVSSW